MQFNSGQCPACQGKLHINRLSCTQCKAEFPVDVSLSPYDYLTEEQAEFLALFLQCRGSLRSVGERLNLSYPAVKRRLDLLLSALGYIEEEQETEPEEIDMSIFIKESAPCVKASDIIRKMLYEKGGSAVMPLINGGDCKITLTKKGRSFTSNKLPSGFNYDLSVFDIVVDLLLSSDNGRALKGNSRGKEDKVGYGRCTADTVVGAVAINYFGKKTGDSAFDPVFILAAVLEWADIAINGRGYLELTSHYKNLVKESPKTHRN